MDKFQRSVILIVAVAVLSSPAGADGPGARNAETSAREYTFKRVYHAGRKLDLSQSVRVQAWTGQFRKDDRHIDAYWALRYSVVVGGGSEPGGVAVMPHLVEKVQRGQASGASLLSEYAGEKAPQDADSRRDPRQIPFVAQFDAAGRVASCRGAMDIEDVQESSYREAKVIQRRFARDNDDLRQKVEEPSLYLPPGPVKVGQTWEVTRKLKKLYDLPLYPYDASIADRTRCRLTRVEAVVGGRVATIEVTGRVTAGESGTRLEKTGTIRYNIDAGTLVSHEVRLSGQLAGSTSGRRPPARVELVVGTALSPPRAAPEPPAPPRGLGSLGHDGRVTFAYRRGTRLYPAADGRMWALLPSDPPSPGNARNLAKLKYPVPLLDPLKPAGAALPEMFDTYFVHVDRGGRAWSVDEGDESTVWWIDRGKVHERKYAGVYFSDHRRRPMLPGRAGVDFFEDSEGRVFVPGKYELFVVTRTGWTGMRYPALSDRSARISQDGRFLFRQIGDVVYVARNFSSGVSASASMVLAYKDGQLLDTGWVSSQHVHFLGRAGEGPLVGTMMGVWRLAPREAPAPKDPQVVKELIAALGAERFRDREAATESLLKIGLSAAKPVAEARARTGDLERRTRCDYILRKLRTGSTCTIHPATLDGFAALDLLFETADGLQFYRPWTAGKFHPEPLLICTDGRGVVKRIPLPVYLRRGRLRLEVRRDDGRIVGLGARCTFTLDPAGGRIEPWFSLGRFADSPSLAIVAAKGGAVCLSMQEPGNEEGLTFWYDPAGTPRSDTIAAREIASGLFDETNHEPDWSVAPGPDGRRLWMVQAAGRSQYALAYAEKGKVVRLPGLMSGVRGAVLPLAGTAAIYVPNYRWPICLHDGKTIHTAPRFQELVRQNHAFLMRRMPAGLVYRCRRSSWPMAFVLRLGKNFWLHEEWMERHGRGEGLKEFTGFCDDDGTHEEDMVRLAGVDADKGRLLAHTSDCKALGWFDREGFSRIIQRDSGLAFLENDRTNRPWWRGAWLLDEAVLKRPDKELVDEEGVLIRKDHNTFRLWANGQWHTWTGHVWDGTMYGDSTGTVWQLRSREVALQLRGGRKQTIQLADAMEPEYCEFAEERPGAVWIATDQAFVRLVAERETAGGIGRFSVDRRLSFRSFGYRVRGPWILGGNDFYFTHAGRLYHTTVSDLLSSGAARVGP